jgi:hypothetical protein
MTIVQAGKGRLQNMEPRQIPWSGRLAVIPLIAASLAVITLSGCGSNSSDNSPGASSPTSTATSAGTASPGDTGTICKDVDALKTSVTDLRNVKLNSNTVTTVRRMADQISAQVDQLKTDASASLRPQVDKVSAAVKVLESSLSNAAETPSVESLRVIPSAITGVTQTVNDLRTALPDC